MKKYEGLFILNTAGKEEGVKEIVDKIEAEIKAAGGKVETVQKMDKRPFARVADKKVNSGFYVNVIFEVDPQALSKLRAHLGMNEDVHRVLFSQHKAAAAKPIPAQIA